MASDDGSSPALGVGDKLRVLIDDMEMELSMLRAAVEKGEQQRATIPSMGLAQEFEFARITAE